MASVPSYGASVQLRPSRDLAMVKRVIRLHVGLAVTAVRPIPSGVNDVLLVSCEEQQVVARFNLAAELGRFRKEAWCIERAAEVRVGGPEVLGVGTDGAYAFIVESFVGGRRGDAVPEADQRQIWRDLGGHLRRVHAVPVGGFGEELADLTGGGGYGADWNRYLGFNRSALTPADPLLELDGFDDETQKRLRRMFEILAGATLRFGLCHGDPSLSNVILGDDGVLRLIDWGEAHAHVVPHFDLGGILQGGLDEQAPEFQAVLDGYGLDRAGYEAIGPEVIALRLLIATDKVRWAIDRKPERLPAKVETLRSLLRRWPTV